MSLFLGLLLQATQPFTLPEGFQLEPALEPTVSYLALAFDARDRLLIATESNGILRATDEDKDGFFESVTPLAPTVQAVQGLCIAWGQLYAVGRVDDVSGLWRMPYPDPAIAHPEQVLHFLDDNEHGAHAAVLGPDGNLWLSLGDQTRVRGNPFLEGWTRDEWPALIESLEDPTGFGRSTKFPFGQLISVDAAGQVTRHSSGYRNAYDLAFDFSGDAFLVDSDMEWDMSLPWYRSTRLCLALPGADFGYRPGSRVELAASGDIAPVVAELGPGSPTGIVFYDHYRFPERYRGSLFYGDWSRGVVESLRLIEDGAGYRAERETVISTEGAFQVTDMEVAADGSLILSTGGRASLGNVWRLSYQGNAEAQPELEDDWQRFLAEPRPRSAAARARTARLRADMGQDWLPQLRAAVLDRDRSVRERVRALALLRLEGVDPEFEPGCLEVAPVGLRRAAAAWDLARPCIASKDPDPGVQRRRLASGGIWRENLRGARDPWLRQVLRESLRIDPIPTLDGLDVDRIYASLRRGESQADVLPGLAASLVDALKPNQNVAPGVELERAIEAVNVLLAAVRSVPEPEGIDAAIDRLLSAPWKGDPRFDRPAAQLMVRFGQARSLKVLLPRLSDPELPREERFYLAYLLRTVNAGWSNERRIELFDFFEEAVKWKGGSNYLRYVRRLTADIAAETPPTLAVALAKSRKLGPWALSHLVAAQPAQRARRMIPEVQQSFAKMDFAGQRVLLRALGTSGAQAALAWLREIYEQQPELRPDVLFALSPVAERRDLELLLEGLNIGSSQLAETCARRLLRLGPLPDDVDEAVVQRRVMRSARIGSARVSRLLLRLLTVWSRGADPIEGELNDQLIAWQERIDARFPPPEGTQTSPLGPLEGPTRELDRVLAFLKESEQRPGSAAAGRVVYEATSCHTCHAMAGFVGAAGATPTDSGWGPDLTTVARRMSRDDLVRHIFDPSLAVAERFRNTLIVDVDDQLIEGRILREDDAELELVDSAGRNSVLDKADIATRKLSDLSPMPSGLLAQRSLEEIKDLLAYLNAEGVVEGEAPAPWEPLLIRDDWQLGEPWRLENGLLEGYAVGLLANEYALLPGDWKDFELELDILLHGEPEANSGLQYRSNLMEDRVDPVGYQVDAGHRLFGAIYATDGRGELGRGEDLAALRAIDSSAWNHLYLRVEGDRHQVEWNGKPILTLRDGRYPSGLLAIQLHERMAMAVRIAHLRVRPLE